MLNILGGNDPDSYLKLAEAADSIVGARVHLYGKFKATKGRKMGHITVLGDTMAEAEAGKCLLIISLSCWFMSTRSILPLNASRL